MLNLIFGLLLLAGVVFALLPKTRFLAAYFLITPVVTLGFALLSFVLSAWLTRGANHQIQATIVQSTFLAAVLLGLLAGTLTARWANRRLSL
ncbi:MAG: hypothetical protein ABIP81_02125 [Terriglobales bacterium]